VSAAHTLQKARVSGWVALRNPSFDGPVLMRCKLADEPWIDFELTDDRPDVVAALGQSHGIVAARGGARYLDLPQTGVALPVRIRFEAVGAAADAGTYALSAEPDLELLETFAAQPRAMVDLSTEHLRGHGLEFGALHLPLAVHPSCTVEYADQTTDDELRALFPEIVETYGDRIVRVDHCIDLNRDDLSALAPIGFDFFIANGVLEHLANPIGFLARVARIMRPGAILFLSIPDRDYAFDTRRALTPFAHLWAEYEAGTSEVSDEHLVEYLEGRFGFSTQNDPLARQAMFVEHRRHTIHVHVWDDRSFSEFLDRVNAHVPLDLEFVARCGPVAGEGNIVTVLRKLMSAR
jgi:SAM-dependent methyltransferase